MKEAKPSFEKIMTMENAQQMYQFNNTPSSTLEPSAISVR
jgi:hypothetical protein